MGELYSIKGETLTAIADALRGKLGETERITVIEQQPANADEVFCSNNMVDFGVFTDELLEGSSSSIYSKNIVINNPDGKTKIKYFVSKMTFTVAKDTVSGEKLLYVDGTSATPVEGEIIVDHPTISLRAVSGDHDTSNGYYVEVYMMDADGNYKSGFVDAEVEKDIPRTFQPSEMAPAIEGLKTPPAEAFTFTGDCGYRFAQGGWKWFIEQYGDQITTKDITFATNMFDKTTATEIPFVINMANNTAKFSAMFNGAQWLIKAPRIHVNFLTLTPGEVDFANMFHGCYKVQNLEEVFDPDELEPLKNVKVSVYYSTPEYNGILQYCHSMRNIPSWWYKLRISEESAAYPSNNYCLYNNALSNCNALDEAKNIPVLNTQGSQTSNMFGYSFQNCYRLKDLTFETNEDGTPKVVNWKSQIIDLSTSVGWSSNNAYINYTPDITLNHAVRDDETYQALKDDPNWYAMKVEYSRYNHDSAVATINSLPDTSAYLASAGGTNTIKFKGASGSATDGGAVNTLTEEEIAIATSRGWTVTLT